MTEEFISYKGDSLKAEQSRLDTVASLVPLPTGDEGKVHETVKASMYKAGVRFLDEIGRAM